MAREPGETLMITASGSLFRRKSEQIFLQSIATQRLPSARLSKVTTFAKSVSNQTIFRLHFNYIYAERLFQYFTNLNDKHFWPFAVLNSGKQVFQRVRRDLFEFLENSSVKYWGARPQLFSNLNFEPLNLKSCLKPDWLMYRREFLFKYSYNWLKLSFRWASKWREVLISDDNSYSPSLKSGVTLAVFQLSGKLAVPNDLLNNKTKERSINGNASFRK